MEWPLRRGIRTRQISICHDEAEPLLAQVTHKVLRKDPKLREWFKRIKRRRGAKIARVAVMRKLTTIFWHMLSKRKKYAEFRALASA